MRLPTLLLTAAALTAACGLRGAPLQETTIDSVSAESVSTDVETTTEFHDQVLAIGNDLTLNCDYLKVVATRIGDKTATLGKYGKFRYMLATGHVKIVQAGRVATCGRAEVFPNEDRVVLTEDPVVEIASEGYKASGPRMVLYRGQRRAVIEGLPGQHVHITLPAIKDLGFPADKPSR
jgi:lipopolysaccharide export system protein LptA